jgi:hypothetical protein
MTLSAELVTHFTNDLQKRFPSAVIVYKQDRTWDVRYIDEDFEYTDSYKLMYAQLICFASTEEAL